MDKERHVKLFRQGLYQSFQIPREFEFEGDEAILRKDGDRLILEPICTGSLLATLRELGPMEEVFPDIDDFEDILDKPE